MNVMKIYILKKTENIKIMSDKQWREKRNRWQSKLDHTCIFIMHVLLQVYKADTT
jgi:hypothetical protein